jgi:hypothetical protein
MTRQIWSRGAAVAAMVFVLGVGQIQAVEYANIDMVDGPAPTYTSLPTVSIPAGQQTANFFIDAGSTVGEVPIRIGASAADDASGGILIVTARETVRIPVDGPVAGPTSTNPPPGTPLGLQPSVSTVPDDDPTSVNTRNASGGLAIVIDRAGSNQTVTGYTAGSAMNANIAAAYFPFSEGWKGGVGYASSNDGPINTFFGSSGITFNPLVGVGNTAHIRPNYFNGFTRAADNTVTPPITAVPAGINNDSFPEHAYNATAGVANGHHYVSIPEVTDSRQQGILLAMHAKNEDNFATVSPLADGSGWHLNTRSNNGTNNGDSPAHGENDPFSFVFVPLGTPNVTMASMWGASTVDNGATGSSGDPVAVLKSGSNFSVTKLPAPNGRFRLAIDGQTPSSGTLIVQSHSNLTGNGGLPADNNVTFSVDPSDPNAWVIYSDDLQNVNTNPLNGQNAQIEEPVPYFSFVFMPFNAPPGTPTIPAPAWDKESKFAYNTNVKEYPGSGNSQDAAGGPGMFLSVVNGTSGLNYQALALNKADNRIHVNGALPSGGDGMMFSTSREGFRDNSTTGGAAQYTIASSYLNGDNVWVTASSTMDPDLGENNNNYATAFFGKNSGFQMGTTAVPTAGGLSTVLLGDVGAASVNDGVLIANNAANEDNFVTVTTRSDGTGWDITNTDNGSFTQNIAANYVYLPYTAQNLVAGRVNPDGSLVNSTTASGFTLTKDPSQPGSYLLTVAGKSPTTGMLLLDAGANGDAASSDNAIAYETSQTDPSLAANVFRILTIDSVTSAEKVGGTPAALEDSSFVFAYFDFANPPTVAPGNFLSADFDEDGDVDGTDLGTIKTNFGAGNAGGDTDGDGDTDGADFLTWQRQLGTTPPTVAAAGAVPEPTAIALVLTAGAALAVARRRSK